MAGFQQTMIIGNVGRSPEMRFTQAGVAVCDFSVAVSRRWTDRATNEKREQTTWFRVTCWRNLAETCNQYVTKGMQVMVKGNIEASAYARQDGQPAASLELTAEEVQFLGARPENDARQEQGGFEQQADLPF
ncbi:single-stranded DNA-binding protein [Aggregatilinea lenta]|uniref:single-stranded DNA-binding protein n=1 Tax=Aggregatilinea lenta TaxID=913108 RepID=UPI000E5B10D8|nr:single-stranded DNA-binding protein [Aggregatilinea lenta]